jgi:hypothetical protein
MQRHSLGVYIIATVEMLAGFLLTWGGIQMIRQIERVGHSRADDLLATSALMVAGVGILAAGVAALLIHVLGAGVIRIVHIAAIVAELWMVLAGAGMMWVGKRHGGDWAGVTILGGTVFVAIGGVLLLLSFFAFRYVERVKLRSLSPPNL